MRIKSVLVTGGSGFIGRNLVDRMVADGLRASVLDVAATEGLTDGRGVKYFHGDMSSREVLSSAVEGADAVVHLAWSTIPQSSNEDPAFDVTSNVAGSLKLLDACVERGVKKFVFVSSGGTVYGIPERSPIGESAPLEPINSYGVTKLAVEKYLELYRRMHGLEYVVLRPSNPYGPQQNPLGKVGTVAVFMYRTLAGLPIHIWGDGSVVRDYVYIGDLVDAAAKALSHSPASDRIFNISSGEGVSLKGLIEKVEAATGRRPEVVYEPGRAFDVPVSVLDNTRARDEMGWSPATPFEEGLKKTLAWMEEWMRRGKEKA